MPVHFPGVVVNIRMKNVYPFTTAYAYSYTDPFHARHSWKPRMLRPLGIGFLVVCLLAVIAVLEVAARTLPHSEGISQLPTNKTEHIPQAIQVFRRQTSRNYLMDGDDSEVDSQSGGPDPFHQVWDTAQEFTASTTSFPASLIPLIHLPSDWAGCPDTTCPPPAESESSAYLANGPPTTQPSLLPSASYTPSAYVNARPSIPATPSSQRPPIYHPPPLRPPSTETSSLPPPPNYETAPSAYQHPGSPITTTLFLIPQLVNGITSSVYLADGPLSSTTSSSKRLPQPSSEVPAQDSLAFLDAEPTLTATPSKHPQTYYPPPPVSSTSSSAYVTAGPPLTVAPASSLSKSSSAFTTDRPISSYSPNDNSTTQSHIKSSASETSTKSSETITQTLTFFAITNHQNPYFNPELLPPQKQSGPFIIYVYSVLYPQWAGFMGSGAFAVTLLTVIYGVWSAFYCQMALVEPFAHMALPEGASARDALFTNYMDQSLLLGPLRALQSRRWLYFIISFFALLSTLFIPISSEVFLTNTNSCTESPPGLDAHGPNPCPPQLMVNYLALRALQGIIGSVAIIVLIIGVLLQHRINGVSSNPSTITAVASLIRHPETLRILRSIPPCATLQESKRTLNATRFRLMSYECVDGTWKYGIVPVSTLTDHHDEAVWFSTCVKHQEINRYSWARDTILGILLLGLLIIITSYFKISDQSNKFNQFFNSQSFGARFILTGCGSTIALLWHNIYTEVEATSRFTKLSLRNAPAETLLIKYNSMSFTSLTQSLHRRQYFTSAIAFTKMLTFLLVIALPGIPYRSGQTLKEYIICNYVSIAVICVLLIVLVAIVIWRRRLPKWPRKPDCLASIMTYLVDSDLLGHFDRANEDFNESGRSAITTIKNRRWAFDKCEGPDGVVRWSVVEENEDSFLSVKQKPGDLTPEEPSTPFEQSPSLMEFSPPRRIPQPLLVRRTASHHQYDV